MLKLVLEHKTNSKLFNIIQIPDKTMVFDAAFQTALQWGCSITELEISVCTQKINVSVITEDITEDTLVSKIGVNNG